MHDTKTLRRHAALLDRMATAQGVDLQDAAIRGDISMDALADAVLRCVDCPDPEHCAQWLAVHASGAKATPQYCRNRDMLNGLRPIPQAGQA